MKTLKGLFLTLTGLTFQLSTQPVYSFEGQWDGMNGLVIQLLQASEYVDAKNLDAATQAVKAAIATSKTFPKTDVALESTRTALESFLKTATTSTATQHLNKNVFQNHLRKAMRQILDHSTSFAAGNPYRGIQIQPKTSYGRDNVRFIRVGKILGPVDSIQIQFSYSSALFKKIVFNSGLAEEYQVDVQNFEANGHVPVIMAKARELDNIVLAAESAVYRPKQTYLETWIYLSKPGTPTYRETTLMPSPSPAP